MPRRFYRNFTILAYMSQGCTNCLILVSVVSSFKEYLCHIFKVPWITLTFSHSDNGNSKVCRNVEKVVHHAV